MKFSRRGYWGKFFWHNASSHAHINRFVFLLSSLLGLGFLGFACNMPTVEPVLETQSPETQGQKPVIKEVETVAPLQMTGPMPEAGDTLRWVDSSTLVYIPAGTFVMGLGGDDNPEHEVYLDGFWIYRTEVTYSMYLRCMALGKCPPPVSDPSIPNLEDPALTNLPVIDVRWDYADIYCQSIGGHLPTEAQWEKTARGTDARLYPWGNGEPNCELLNYENCTGETTPVVAYPLGTSPYDVLDMAGNVSEWVADWYQENYYIEAPHDNPSGPEASPVRSVRGSTFVAGPDEIASALRGFLGPDEYRSDLGFRCVVDAAHEFAPPCEILADAPSETDLAANPGTGPGGSASCVVPQPQLSVVTYCEKGVRGNNASWTPADAEMNYSAHEGASCSQYDADTLACTGPPGSSVYVEVCKSCPPPVVQLGVPGSCDPPYALDEPAGLCTYTGEALPDRQVCAPGFELLPDSSCCEMQDGTPLDYPVCPPGGAYDPASRICWYTLPSTGDQKCDSQTIYFDSCVRQGGSDDGGSGPGSCAQYGSAAECRAHLSDGCAWDWKNNVCVGP